MKKTDVIPAFNLFTVFGRHRQEKSKNKQTNNNKKLNKIITNCFMCY